jgi:serine phosphatase RsbU (regulator of sigma subunit)
MAGRKNIPTFQLLVIVILLIYILNLTESIVIVLKTGEWQGLIGKIISFLIIVFIAYRSWEVIRHGREAYLQRLEDRKDVGLKDAAMFSLTWSREIYRRIPEDRKPLVQNAFILIAIALGVAYLQFGNLLTMLLVAVLIMAAVNLLVWAVASEREEKNRMQIELETARQMQLSLMPKQDPKVRGYDISGICIPALDVGGDLFDYAWFGKEKKKFCVVVVDVSGKGMDAAMTAVYTSGAFISEIQHERDVVSIAENLNSGLYSRQDKNRFVSALMLALDVRSGEIEYVNAGQSRPLLYHQDRVSELKSQGTRFPLGVRELPGYQSASEQLQPGDRLLLCTDGLSEAMNINQEMYGNQRLEKLFLSLGREKLSSREMVMRLKETVMDFSAPAQQHDDLTIVCLTAL